jgi:hypothetical protein
MALRTWTPGLLALLALSATAYADRGFNAAEKRQLRRISTMDRVSATAVTAPGIYEGGRVDGESGKGKHRVWRLVMMGRAIVTEVGKNYRISRSSKGVTTRIQITDPQRVPPLVLRLMRDGQLKRGILRKGDLVTYGLSKGSKKLAVELWRPELDLELNDVDNEWELLDRVSIPAKRQKRIWNRTQMER